MKPDFAVEVVSFELLEEIPGVWMPADFATLLDAMDYGATEGLSEAELREMCLLSLQDLDPDEAAALLLRHQLGDRLTSGQIQNMSVEMLDEKLWVEYSDMALHERLFNVGSLLYQAVPGVFPEPHAVQLSVRVTANNDDAREILAAPLHESFVTRLLADGMEDSVPLHRLFGAELKGSSFAEAEQIVWILESTREADGDARIAVVSSAAWLDPMRGTRSYQSAAYPDEA